MSSRPRGASGPHSIALRSSLTRRPMQPLHLPRPRRHGERASRRAFASERRRCALESCRSRRTSPLIPIEADFLFADQRLSLPLNPSADPPEDLFRLLDKQLITSNGSDTLLHLLTQVPTVLFFHIDRITNVTSLDSFGSGNNGLQKRVFRPTPTGKEDVWLDRYWVKNRVRIHETRKEIAKLDAELDEVKKQRKAVVVTEDGKDFQELVRATVEYCRSAKAEAGNVEREERQKRMREDWEKVEEELKQAVDGASARFTKLFDAVELTLRIRWQPSTRRLPTSACGSPQLSNLPTCTRSAPTVLPRSSSATV